MAEKIRKIGRDPSLRFEIALGVPAARDRALAWGEVRLFLDGQVIWGSEGDRVGAEPKPLQWTWVELLEYLGKWWPWLCFEETYPIPGVNPLYPCQLHQEAEDRWLNLHLDIAEAEELDVYRYLLRHDLSLALNGCYVPSLLIKPQGEQFIISSAALRESFILPREDVIDTLIALGDHLADFLRGSSCVRARLAVEGWENRMLRPPGFFIGILSGLGDDERAALAEGEPEASFWGMDPQLPFQDTEVLAAARMTRGIISPEAQQFLLRKIKSTSLKKTPKLDDLSHTVSKSFEEVGKPFAQGYWLAQWLRDYLKQPEDSLLDLEGLLRSWGIELIEECFPDASIDALAVWGPRHGPSIIMNCTEPAKPAHEHGRRTTLAHEICHLLIDRERALPLGEVLGGRVAEYAEKRARAFAAELLLPRKVVARAFRQADSLTSAIREMKGRYKVSEQLIAWQLRNTPELALKREEAALLERITGDYPDR